MDKSFTMMTKNKGPLFGSLWYACADWLPVGSEMTHLRALLAVVQDVCTPIQQIRRNVVKNFKLMQQDVVAHPVKRFRRVDET